MSSSSSSISNIMDGVVFVNREEKVGLINPVAKEMLGERALEAMGKPVAEVFGDEENELLRTALEDLQRVRA